jgi:uncharacterized protein (UPF0332 family)
MEVNLIKNIKIILDSANTIYNTRDYTSSTILYFKALFLILDYILLIKEGKTPKDHNERFRLLQTSFPELYDILDKIFPIYRTTYSLTIEKIKCDLVIKNVKQIIERYKIPI